MSNNSLSFLTSYFLITPAITAQSQTAMWMRTWLASRLRMGRRKKEKDNDDMEVSEKDVNGYNDDEEEDRPKKIKEEMPKNLSLVKGVVDSDNFLPLNFNRKTLQESNIIKVISKKLGRKAIDMLRNLV